MQRDDFPAVCFSGVNAPAHTKTDALIRQRLVSLNRLIPAITCDNTFPVGVKKNDVREHREKTRFTYPSAKVDGEDGRFPLLQEKDDHEGKGVRGDATFGLAVNVTQLQRETNCINFNPNRAAEMNPHSSYLNI